ncbi:hypothetical protein TRFO_26370 [Tritrichomonas foetus]|uniref:UDENN domain-containing protein n=1 Tax=Tritrichomonas foetus TaxID=1144522 RepID=A0A1J4K3M1_9EUKA|nr:hypothetical protein TRFO_26370 [Tritrichomonas foetus]|eukprot:OHT05779.1 hypothetical protein TRFO_26370 [Tritrichomonas foetus]
MTDRYETIDKNSFLRFYNGEGTFFESLSVWVIDSNMINRHLLWSFPRNTQSLNGSSSDHIFPSVNSLPDLSEPIFHMATVSPEDGIRIIYSIMFEAQSNIQFGGADGTYKIPERSLVILAIESKYFHPSSYKSILTHLYNRLPYKAVMLDTEIDYYINPKTNRTKNSFEFIGLPFDLSQEAEIGRFHHFIFSTLPVKQILSLIFYLLCGSSTLVTSSTTTQLCFGCFSMLSLLYPIQWPNMLVTALPEYLLDYASAPVPFIIGIPFNLLSKPQLAHFESELIVNLDFANVSSPNTIDIKGKYKLLLRKVAQKINKALDIYRENGIFQAAEIQIYIWEYIIGIALIATDNIGSDYSDKELMDKLAVQIFELSKTPNKKNSPVLDALIDGTVLVHFSELILERNTENMPKKFFSVTKNMGPLMNSLK